MGTDRPTPGDVTTSGVGVAVNSMRATAPAARSPTSAQVRVWTAPTVLTTGSSATGVPPGCGMVSTALPAS